MPENLDPIPIIRDLIKVINSHGLDDAAATLILAETIGVILGSGQVPLEAAGKVSEEVARSMAASWFRVLKAVDASANRR